MMMNRSKGSFWIQCWRFGCSSCRFALMTMQEFVITFCPIDSATFAN